MKSCLALLGGSKFVKEAIIPRSPFSSNDVEKIKDLFGSRPLSTLFGEHDIAQFEKVFCSVVGSRYGVAVNSGTSALHSSAVSLGIGKGDEVIVTCFSFVASVSTIIQTGAIPVFVDIDKSNLGIDVSLIEVLINKRTKAISVTHILGIPSAIIEIQKICRKYNLLLIEDCCQALGTSINGRHVGSFGDVGCFSFNVNKIVQTGEGGMIITEKEYVSEACRELRVNGLSHFGIERLGYNYTMTNLQALLGISQLSELNTILDKRRKNVAILKDTLKDVEFINYDDSVTYSHYRLPIFVGKYHEKYMNFILEAIISEGIPVQPRYQLLTEVPFIKNKYRVASCEVGRDLLSRMIPIDPSHLIDSDDMVKIAGGIQKVLSNIEDIKYAIRDGII